MTIKDFSKLCGCNPQTLRFYDRENLLKPVKVDEWSGYRYYDEDQAITFVRIKNLQKAGFTIDEIKSLLDKDDTAIFYAFEAKITEEKKKIQEIIQIQKAYQTEIITMKNKIEAIRNDIMCAMESYDPTNEFGLSRDEYAGMVERVDSVFRKILVEGEDSVIKKIFREGERSEFEYEDSSKRFEYEDSSSEEKKFEDKILSTDYEVIYENHLWEYAKEFLDEIPELSEDDEYSFMIKVNPNKGNNTAFANTLLHTVFFKQQKKLNLACQVLDSEDGKNHFWLLKRN